MSYLEIKETSLPDMSSGIISFWVREISKQQEHPPPAQNWPQGFWTEATAGTTMVPPNAQYSIGYDAAFKGKSIFYYNPYGFPTGALIFGDLLLGPAVVWIPNSPPVPLDTMSVNEAGAGAIDGVADIDMSKYGIRALLTFGDPNIDYKYCTWRAEKPNVINAVQYPPTTGTGGESGVVPDWPHPYRPYLKVIQGEPVGVDGLMTVANYRLNSPTTKFKVPPSFIGIDNDGHLIINLQTKQRATYKGMSFEMSKISEMWATATYLEIIGPPYSYTQLGFPFPDGTWIDLGGFWLGYQFEYTDISQNIMGCAPESFLIYAANVGLIDFAFSAPVIQDNVWHHVLFSFDINGEVTTDLAVKDTPAVNTTCKAWLAFDDNNITGANLQNRPPLHDGFLLPKLRGTETTSILDCGPTASYGRGTLKLGLNDILPRNAWLGGWRGHPKDYGALLQYIVAADLITNEDEPKSNQARAYGGVVGDFNWIDWTGAIWPLYGHGVAPGIWQATYSPMHPTVPDPATFNAPSYSCSNFVIPVNGHPIGVPAGTALAKYNTGVEMAELQIWANKTLDTGNEAMRRLFIDWPTDENGNLDKTKPMIPVKPSVAAQMLGKPDILLHGSKDWQKGSNTGQAPDQFKPVSAIEKFKPDPELGV